MLERIRPSGGHVSALSPGGVLHLLGQGEEQGGAVQAAQEEELYSYH